MKLITTIIALSAVCLFTSCKSDDSAAAVAANIDDDPKAVAEKIASLQSDLADTMEGVEDKESAEAALGKVEGIISEMTILAEAMKNAEEPSAEETKELEAIATEGQDRLTAAMTKAMPVFMSDPALLEKLQAVMQKLAQTQ